MPVIVLEKHLLVFLLTLTLPLIQFVFKSVAWLLVGSLLDAHRGLFVSDGLLDPLFCLVAGNEQ